MRKTYYVGGGINIKKGGMFNITAVLDNTEITFTDGNTSSFTFNIEYSKNGYG